MMQIPFTTGMYSYKTLLVSEIILNGQKKNPMLEKKKLM